MRLFLLAALLLSQTVVATPADETFKMDELKGTFEIDFKDIRFEPNQRESKWFIKSFQSSGGVEQIKCRIELHSNSNVSRRLNRTVRFKGRPKKTEISLPEDKIKEHREDVARYEKEMKEARKIIEGNYDNFELDGYAPVGKQKAVGYFGDYEEKTKATLDEVTKQLESKGGVNRYTFPSDDSGVKALVCEHSYLSTMKIALHGYAENSKGQEKGKGFKVAHKEFRDWAEFGPFQPEETKMFTVQAVTTAFGNVGDKLNGENRVQVHLGDENLVLHERRPHANSVKGVAHF